jgi:transposase
MIKEHIRKTIIDLYNQGFKKKVIARNFGIDIKTVRKICKEEDSVYSKERANKKTVNPELLLQLYTYCNGYVKRMHELLTEEYRIDIGYSTLTRLIAEQGIGKKQTPRSMQFPDVPGDEMQHDTSVYTVLINGKKTKVVCSTLYLRYSKLLYVKFYLHFNRFKMKCFIHEALTFWGYSANICIIDNTNLAVKHGTGEKAVFYPEIISFAHNYFFHWKAHRIGHANRKAGEERGFYTIETNFLPGRTFSSLDNLNTQAFQWATVRRANRAISKTRLIPLILFESEKVYLNKLPSIIPAPYLAHKRIIDQYGYIALNANYYWVPEKVNDKNIISREMDVIEYDNKIVIYHKQKQLISYDKVMEGISNEKVVPDGMKKQLYHQPKAIKKGCEDEEKQLRQLGPVCCRYLDFIHSKECRIKQKQKYIRDLYSLSKKMDLQLLNQTIERALTYQIENIQALERIGLQLLKNDSQVNIEIEGPGHYKQRENYQKGKFSKENDLGYYRKLQNDFKNNK